MTKITAFNWGRERAPRITLVRTDDVLAPHHLMELFSCNDEGDYDGPDLDECDGIIQVCDGAWRLEPDGELWRFWKDPELEG